jgi:hypothetical protein
MTLWLQATLTFIGKPKTNLHNVGKIIYLTEIHMTSSVDFVKNVLQVQSIYRKHDKYLK